MSMSFKASPDGTYGEILVNGQVVAKLPVTGNAVIPNLVGTVSQSGGIPTGAVVERGSNANGEYVRFADGTQICTRTKVSVAQPTTASGSVFVGNAQTTLFFAASFTTFPAVTAFVDGGLTNAGLIMGTNGSNESQFAVLPWRSTSFSANPTISYIAIGRWY